MADVGLQERRDLPLAQDLPQAAGSRALLVFGVFLGQLGKILSSHGAVAQLRQTSHGASPVVGDDPGTHEDVTGAQLVFPLLVEPDEVESVHGAHRVRYLLRLELEGGRFELRHQHAELETAEIPSRGGRARVFRVDPRKLGEVSPFLQLLLDTGDIVHRPGENLLGGAHFDVDLADGNLGRQGVGVRFS